MQYVYVLTIRKRHSSTYLHQGPYETTFKFTRSGFFYYDMQQIAHTHKYQSPYNVYSFSLNPNEFLPGKNVKMLGIYPLIRVCTNILWVFP